MAYEKNLVQLIEAQIKMEISTSKKIKDMEEEVTNVAAKLFLAEMRFDTEKHAKILRKMLDLIRRFEDQFSSKKFWQIQTREFVDAITAKDMLKRHMKVEIKMLEHLGKEIEKTDDDALKTLFTHISQDEKKHHKILQDILEKAFKIMSIP